MSQFRAFSILGCSLILASVGVVAAQDVPARPSVERALRAAETPDGDFGGRPLANMSPVELQTTYRWMGLEYGLRYRYEAVHAEAWLKLLRDDKKSIYARLIAAFYLIDDHEEARNFVAEQMKSPNLRTRYNAAALVERYARPYRKSPQQTWALRLLIEALSDGSLDGSGVKSVPANEGPERDSDDILGTPIDDICSSMASLKPPEAVPALISVLQRRPQTHGAAYSLGAIGDPRAIPVLMELLKNDSGRDDGAEAAALARLKHKEAVPLIIERLKKSDPNRFGETQSLLMALLELNDRRAVAPLQQFLASDHPDDAKRVARRVLVRLRSDDPVKDLIDLLDRETEWVELSELIDALATYHDARVTAKFVDLARASDFADTRQNAINGLARLGDRRSLLALASLLDHPWPANLKERHVGKPTPEPDYPKTFPNVIESNLKHATNQNFGRDRRRWEAWITENVAEANPTEKR